MADVKISALPAAAALTGAETAPAVQSGSTVKVLMSAIATYVNGLFEAPNDGTPFLRQSQSWKRTYITPAYVSGNWYPADLGLTLVGGTAVSASTIYLLPLVIYMDTTITDLGVEITTAVASSNFQVAIYGSDATNKKPNGAALATTTSMSGATATTVSQTLGSPLALTAGLYWLAVNSDSAVGFRSLSGGQSWTASLIGSATLGNVSSANPGRMTFTIAQAFGTWPSLTPASLTEATGSSRGAVGCYKVQ